jgi:hypothetical protein
LRIGLGSLGVKAAKEKEPARELPQDESIELFENGMKMMRERPNPVYVVQGPLKS